MHYLIIAVLAFGLSLLGCEGKTGPAGPSGSAGVAGPAGPAGPQGSTGPQGPAGPAGADGATGPAGPQGEKGDPGETGPAGPEGPQGPAGADGEAGIPGVDITEIAQAHHIAFKIGDADKVAAGVGDDGISKTLRIGEERMITAVVRSQSGEVLESLVVTIVETKDADNAIATAVDEDDSGMAMVTAEQKGTATLTATAALVGIAGDLKYTVTKPITKITLHQGDAAKTKTVAEGDLKDHDAEAILAVGESTGVIQAVARDEDDNPLTPRGGFKWASDSGSIAGVALRDAKEKKDVQTHSAIITGKGAGGTTVTVMALSEDELGDPASKDIDVTVSGFTVTREMTITEPSVSTFTWDKNPAGGDAPSWKKFADFPSTFDVELYNTRSGDQVNLTVAALDISGAKNFIVIETQNGNATDNNQSVTVSVHPLAVDVSDPPADTDVVFTADTVSGMVATDPPKTETSTSDVLTLTVKGAENQKIRFSISLVSTEE